MKFGVLEIYRTTFKSSEGEIPGGTLRGIESDSLVEFVEHLLEFFDVDSPEYHFWIDIDQWGRDLEVRRTEDPNFDYSASFAGEAIFFFLLPNGKTVFPHITGRFTRFSEIISLEDKDTQQAFSLAQLIIKNRFSFPWEVCEDNVEIVKQYFLPIKKDVSDMDFQQISHEELSQLNWAGVKFNKYTVFPAGFDPVIAGGVLV